MKTFKLISWFNMKGSRLMMFTLLILLQACQSNSVQIEYDNSAHIQDTLLDIPNRLSFKNYTVENGLPENSVFSIKEDFGGNIWVTTQNGIAKFSNNNFIAYTNSTVDSNTIFPDYNWINIMADSTLVAYSSLGVSKYNNKADRFERVLTVPKEDKLYDLHDENNQVDFDHVGYWYQALADSVYRCITLDDQIFNFNVKGVVRKKISFTDFSIIQTVDKDSVSYIYQIEIEQGEAIIKLISKSQTSIGDIVAIDTSTYYYMSNDSVFHSKEGYKTKSNVRDQYHTNTILYHPKSENLTVLTSYDSIIQIQFMENGQLMSKCDDVSGFLIDACIANKNEVLFLVHEVNVRDKVRLYSVHNSKLRKIKTDLNDQFNLFYDAYRKICFDKNNNIFIGTWSNGVFHTNLNNNISFKYNLDFEDETVIPFYAENDIIYFYTYRGGFFSFNLKNGEQTELYSVSSDNILTSFKRINDKIYITATDEGLILFDVKTKLFYSGEINNYLSEGDIFVTNSLVDSKGRTWLTSSVEFYSKYSIILLEGQELKSFNSDDSVKTFKDPRIMDVFEYEGRIYITVQVYGLYVFEEDTGEFIGLEEDEVIQMSRLVKIKNNEIWSSSFTNGLVKIVLPSHEIRDYYSRENEKLPISWINHFCFVSDTIILLKGDTEHWYTLNLNTNIYNIVNSYNEEFFHYNFDAIPYEDKYTILPAKSGIVIYDFQSKIKPSVKTVNIESIEINNKTKIGNNKRKIKSVNLSHENNNLIIKLNNSKPFNIHNQYYYRIIGYNDSWVKFDIDNDIIINSLFPGNYKLEIQVIGANLEKSEIKTILEFSVAKPWWQTIWFYLILVIVIFGVGYLIFRLKTQQLLQRQVKLEQKIEEATTEIRAKKEEVESQKRAVEQQKQIIEEVHKEITDSINYAERIQRSFLATSDLLDKHLDNYFVYFNPKEAVSGDFYWAGELADGNFAISCADSTGHGVPGAIMSILNISSIEKAVENGATKSSDIFNQARITIIERLKKDGSAEGGKDGMDASLLILNPEKTKLEYVAANNPIWIVRDGELIDIKGEKMPVGKHDNDHIPFEGGEFELQKGDIIYAMTDGFQDQFGGEKGKKFKVKPMKQMLLDIATLPMHEQENKIAEAFDSWKKDLEQVDDVCLIGIKV